MVKLYEISDAYRGFVEAIDNEEITDPETIADTLEALNAEFDDKAENIACLYKSLQAEAEAIKAEAKKLSERAAYKERVCERLKDYLSTNMQRIGKDKLETARCKLSFRKSESVNITDGDALYLYCTINGLDELAQTVSTVKFDKTAIKKAIKGGATLDGVEIVTANNIQIK